MLRWIDEAMAPWLWPPLNDPQSRGAEPFPNGVAGGTLPAPITLDGLDCCPWCRVRRARARNPFHVVSRDGGIGVGWRNFVVRLVVRCGK